MKLVFSDVDGTFVQPSGEIAPVNLEATKSLLAQGDRFVLVSGRNPQQLQEVVDTIDLDIDYIFGNGSGYKLHGEEPVYNHVVTSEELDAIEKLFENRDMYYHIHTSHGLVLPPIHLYDESRHMPELLEMVVERYGEIGQQYIMDQRTMFLETGTFSENPFDYLREHPEIHVIKAEVYHASDEEREELTKEANEAGFFAFSSFLSNVEIVPLNSNKGTAIREYQELFPDGKITYGFGDAENDIAMFETVDVAVAMENAVDSILALSDDQTDSVDNGGVGLYIQKHLLDK